MWFAVGVDGGHVAVAHREPEISTTNLLQLPPKLDHSTTFRHAPPRFPRADVV